MKKGISPVIAVVLLIAISVIASVGVWYWVGSYTGKPGVSGIKKTAEIIKCNTTHVYVQNNGQQKLDTTADVYNSNSIQVGYINFPSLVGGGINPGESAWVPIFNTSDEQTTPLDTGNYYLLSSQYQEKEFRCE